MNCILTEAERGHMRRREISEDSFREAVLRVLFEIRDRLPVPVEQPTLTQDLNIICINRDKYIALIAVCESAVGYMQSMNHAAMAKNLAKALKDLG